MPYQDVPRCALALSLALLLVACGSSDDPDDDATGMPEASNPWPIDRSTARTHSGWSAPGATNDDVRPALQQLTDSADSLLISDILFTAGSTAVRGQTTCSHDECSTSAPALGIGGTIELQDFTWNDDPDDEFQTIATHNGVNLAQGRGPSEPLGISVQRYGFGGWMEHNYFIVESSIANLQPFGDVEVHYSQSIGNSPGTNPSAGGGAWHGVMVGMDTSNSATPPHAVQGQASITVASFANPEVDISFSGIHGVANGETYNDMDWTGVPIANGAFEHGTDTDSISGRFYGPNHEEIGGIFERDMILGAFGAMRD